MSTTLDRVFEFKSGFSEQDWEELPIYNCMLSRCWETRHCLNIALEHARKAKKLKVGGAAWRREVMSVLEATCTTCADWVDDIYEDVEASARVSLILLAWDKVRLARHRVNVMTDAEHSRDDKFMEYNTAEMVVDLGCALDVIDAAENAPRVVPADNECREAIPLPRNLPPMSGTVKED